MWNNKGKPRHTHTADTLMRERFEMHDETLTIQSNKISRKHRFAFKELQFFFKISFTFTQFKRHDLQSTKQISALRILGDHCK